MRSGRDGAQGRPMNNLIGALQSCSCSPRMGYPGTFGVARTAAACSRLTALSVPSLRSPFSCSSIHTGAFPLRLFEDGLAGELG